MTINQFSDLNSDTRPQRGPILRDYRHASKLFVDDHFRLIPKMGSLFYVYFDINQDAALPDQWNPLANREIGMLVKTVSLPKFTMDVKKYNAYNRPNFSQSKVIYDPLNITFHDDSSDLIRNFWFDYYNYYYRDADYNPALYSVPHKYESARPTQQWGFSPREKNAPKYLTSIRIYSLHQKRFSEYQIINPIIKSFKHGEHVQGGNEILQHDMSVDYETVLYNCGWISDNTVSGFADLHYDVTKSPLPPPDQAVRQDDTVYRLADSEYKNARRRVLGTGYSVIPGSRNTGGLNVNSLLTTIGTILTIGKILLGKKNSASSVFIPNLPSLGGDLGTIARNAGLPVFGIPGRGGRPNWASNPSGIIRGAVLSLPSMGRRSLAMTNATNYIEQRYPSTPFNANPSPTGDPVEVPGNSQSSSLSGQPTVNDQNDFLASSDQGTSNPESQANDAASNLTALSLQNQVARTNSSTINISLRQSATSIETFQRKYEEAVSTFGADSATAKQYAKLKSNEVIRNNQLEEQLTSVQLTKDKIVNQIAIQTSIITGTQ